MENQLPRGGANCPTEIVYFRDQIGPRILNGP